MSRLAVIPLVIQGGGDIGSADERVRAASKCDNCRGTGACECPGCGHEHDCENCDGNGHLVSLRKETSIELKDGERLVYAVVCLAWAPIIGRRVVYDTRTSAEAAISILLNMIGEEYAVQMFRRAETEAA